MNFPLRFIQVLRGFAAMAVLLYHIDIQLQAWFPQRILNFEYGELGVDFFFALSGFIITYIHFKDITFKGNVKNFIAKRCIRIFPFYWLAVIVSIAFDPQKFYGWPNLFRNLLLFRLPLSQMQLGVAWSLIFEIVFYAIFAVAIAAGWRVARFILAAWLLLILINVGDIFAWSSLMQVIANNLIVEFLCGCAAGYLFINSKHRLSGFQFIVSQLILLGIILLLFYVGFDRFSLVMVATFGLTSALIIFYFATLDRLQRFRALAWRPLVIAGDASYSIYLTHTIYVPIVVQGMSLLFDLRASTMSTGYALLLLLFVISVALGIVIHLLVEKPMLVFLRRRFISHPPHQLPG